MYVLMLSMLINSAAASDVANASPLPPFHAEYQVSRNGNDLARTTIDLKSVDGHWELLTQTKGTSGLARTLGLEVTERSEFDWRNGLPQGLHYHYAQKAAFSSRERNIDFDWPQNNALSKDNKGEWQLSLRPGTIDRNLIVLAISANLKQQLEKLTYPVADGKKLDDRHYVQTTQETVKVPAGEFQAIRVERQRNSGEKSTISWHARERDYLPIQLEQRETNGDTVTMRLAQLELH